MRGQLRPLAGLQIEELDPQLRDGPGCIAAIGGQRHSLHALDGLELPTLSGPHIPESHRVIPRAGDDQVLTREDHVVDEIGVPSQLHLPRLIQIPEADAAVRTRGRQHIAAGSEGMTRHRGSA